MGDSAASTSYFPLMLKTLRRFPVLLFVFLTTSFVALAQVATQPMLPLAPLDPNDPGAIAKMLFDAVMNKQWGIVVSLAIMVVVWALRKFIPEKSTVGVWLRGKIGGVVTTFTLSLGTAFLALFAEGGKVSPELIIKGISVALGASGGWSMFKNIMEAIDEKKAQAAGAAAAAAPTDILNK